MPDGSSSLTPRRSFDPRTGEAELDAQSDTSRGPGHRGPRTAARGLAPRAIATLRDRHAKLGVAFREMEPSEAIPDLRRDLDIAIVQDCSTRPGTYTGLKKAPLLDDIPTSALHEKPSPRDPPSARELSELSNEPWITWSAHPSATTGSSTPCAPRATNRESHTRPPRLRPRWSWWRRAWARP